MYTYCIKKYVNHMVRVVTGFAIELRVECSLWNALHHWFSIIIRNTQPPTLFAKICKTLYSTR